MNSALEKYKSGSAKDVRLKKAQNILLTRPETVPVIALPGSDMKKGPENEEYGPISIACPKNYAVARVKQAIFNKLKMRPDESLNLFIDGKSAKQTKNYSRCEKSRFKHKQRVYTEHKDPEDLTLYFIYSTIPAFGQ